MHHGKKISLVFPAFNEAENIAQAIGDFKALAYLDEIIVVDNNSKDETAKIAKARGAKVVKESEQGYGFALRRGLAEAKGDYVILSEPDNTFSATDTTRFLDHIKDFDMVAGTRTNRNFIEKNANMGLLLQIGNILVAKLIQILFQTGSLSDCGCTFRVLRRSLVKKILPKFTVGGSHFLPETVVLTRLSGGSILEIPIHYRKRVGTSKITGSLKRSFFVALQMIKLIIRYRFASQS